MTIVKRILSWLSVAILSWSITGCSNDTVDSVQAFNPESKHLLPHVEKIAEVQPPQLIQQLNQNFVKTKPQVKILSPTPDEVINSQNVEVKLEVKGLDLFKNEELKMGPHLHFFVDDQPYKAIYSTEEAIALSDLTPGTHTIRVFASRPWHESFKNRGAYAKTTFHVFTATEENNPSPKQPLLTYSRPQGVYGAQPIMLDFYLTDAPLHVVAQESPDDDIADWRIRVTINGESFLLDQWQSIYLQGFDEGKNWIKLEYIDENGDLVKNIFNSTVRAINYDPQLQDTLAKLVTGKISLETAQAITISDYEVKAEKVLFEEIQQETTESEAKNQIKENETIVEEIISTETPNENNSAEEILDEDIVSEINTNQPQEQVEINQPQEENLEVEIIDDNN